MKMTREDKQAIFYARENFKQTLMAYDRKYDNITSDDIIKSAERLKRLLWEHRDDIITVLMVSQDIPS